MTTERVPLRVERKDQPDKTGVFGNEHAGVVTAPLVDEDYWEYRVVVGEHQAVVGFPKFGLIGVGFAVEADDWNSNLPHGTPPKELLKHIRANKGDKSITDATCLEAIRLIDEAVRADGKCTCRRCKA